MRAAFLDAVSDDDIAEIVAGMISAAKSGDVPAAKLLLERCLGKVTAADNVPLVPDESDSQNEPVTAANLAEHKRRLIEEINSIC